MVASAVPPVGTTTGATIPTSGGPTGSPDALSPAVATPLNLSVAVGSVLDVMSPSPGVSGPIRV